MRGRLLIPLSRISKELVGIDVSESMRALARKHCAERSVANVTLLKSDDDLSLLTGKCDFICSCHVFQHIPVQRGMHIVERLLARLDAGGIGVVQFTYQQLDPLRRVIPLVKNYVPFAKNVIHLIRKQSFFSPEMQMNGYNTNSLLTLLHHCGARCAFVDLGRDGSMMEMTMYFKKEEAQAI